MKKEEAYKCAYKQVKAQIKKQVDVVSTLANTAAILKEQQANFFWVGFYLYMDDHLILGPFQGPPACMQLNLSHGVCATSAKTKKTIIVPDVEKFVGHVACDSRSKSEIVVPIFDCKNNLRAVLDVDSESLNDFDEIDSKGLNIITELLKDIWKK